MYKVWIRLKDGSSVEWTWLREDQAFRFYKMMKKHIDWDVSSTVEEIGWEKMK
jgi:hypothetical protein